ncbi:MAG: hypothetical protein K8F31_08130 [Roseovarius sp.]|nr:hypothetical protein [Roseovarius sp.]
MKKVANREAVDAVQDMQRGLHIALDCYLNQNDPAKGEQVLRELDLHLTDWLNQTEVAE